MRANIIIDFQVRFILKWPSCPKGHLTHTVGPLRLLQPMFGARIAPRQTPVLHTDTTCKFYQIGLVAFQTAQYNRSGFQVVVFN